jgi:hypothetical protein
MITAIIVVAEVFEKCGMQFIQVSTTISLVGIWVVIGELLFIKDYCCLL